MQSSLTFSSIAALFGVMVVGALIPGVSVLAVSARSAASGFIHGVFTTIGIVAGDIIFILLAIFGLSVLAETMGGLFVLVKYLGAAYLIWLGVALWRSNSKVVEAERVIESSLLSSFLTGLFITLGDQKAILFYFGFFPAFLDLSTISYFDTGIIIVMATVAIVGVKLGYAFMAVRANLFFKNSNAMKRINIVAGTVMISVGIYLVARA
ncbi:MAG: LysE family translocator [Gammaproteobacteria bacterium]|nr:MAG: LysE family translocator [Gammaproteobacteria bacterium]